MDVLDNFSNVSSLFGVGFKPFGSMSTKLLVICDIDGSLANGASRFALAGHEPDRSDRKSYTTWLREVQDEQRLLEDRPLFPVLEAVKAMYRGDARIVYLTSREEVYRQVTQQWLNKWAAPVGPLYMRGYDDWRSTPELKGSIIKKILTEHSGPIVAIDDDPQGTMTPVYLALGISHLRVMDCLSSWDRKDIA